MRTLVQPPGSAIADAPDTQPDLAGTRILMLSLYDWAERAGSAPPVQRRKVASVVGGQA